MHRRVCAIGRARAGTIRPGFRGAMGVVKDGDRVRYAVLVGISGDLRQGFATASPPRRTRRPG
ncbi:hypothetical protein GCM10010507_38890 [Streptomyces cinnamoneus]|uniref:Uncharacterized protein n=1 Tax=Streptomyces cinnamoneus TaxID=53446 RepID=A0A918TR67_STRCJ|nr:hypothetical protein GCM10010507_38890 [Streptomyces cinnamoneus]